ncbi:MAG TPA: head GIN domain-containing protein [Usitatibacter sp.]|nr:head GIN domain-containing protein [Usitatibacter sp.]
MQRSNRSLMRPLALAAALLALPAAGWPAHALAFPGFEAVQGSGHAVTEERAVSGFHGISVSLPAHVVILQGKEERATVTADDNVLPKLLTNVSGGVLELRFREAVSVRTRTPIEITVRARSIDRIAIAGAAKVEAPRLEGERLLANLSGSTQLVLPGLALGRLSIHSSGHTHALAIGRVDALDLDIDGAGEINAVRLDAKRADISISGSAKVVAWVRDALRVQVSGSGLVSYFGDPAVEKSVSGSAVVARMGSAPP